jgi:hypothetical protein
MQAALIELAGGPEKSGIAVLLDVREMTALNDAVVRAAQVETYELPRGRVTTLRSSPRSLATRDEIARFERRFARRRLLRVGLAVSDAATRRPLRRWCPGRAEVPLELPSFALSPGAWDFAVEQDVAVGDGTILESISDHYYLTVGPTAGSRAQ